MPEPPRLHLDGFPSRRIVVGDPDPGAVVCHPELKAGPFDKLGIQVGGSAAQAVIQVGRSQLETEVGCQLRERMEQHHRVEAAGDADHHRTGLQRHFLHEDDAQAPEEVIHPEWVSSRDRLAEAEAFERALVGCPDDGIRLRLGTQR